MLWADYAGPLLIKTFGHLSRAEIVKMTTKRQRFLKTRGGLKLEYSGARERQGGEPIWTDEEMREYRFWQGYEQYCRLEWKYRWPDFKLRRGKQSEDEDEDE